MPYSANWTKLEALFITNAKSTNFLCGQDGACPFNQTSGLSKVWLVWKY